jgi:putative redox protein
MDITLRYKGGKQFEATARGHAILSDQPLDNAGADAGMTPPELFLASIASCAGYYAAEYLNARGLPSEDLEIRATALKGDKPVRMVSIHLDVTAPGLNKRHRDGVLRAVDACLLKNTLHVPPKVEVQVTGAPVEPKVEAADAVLV